MIIELFLYAYVLIWSFSGAQSIRAYGVQPRFISESEEKVDFNQVCLYPSLIANRYSVIMNIHWCIIGNILGDK